MINLIAKYFWLGWERAHWMDSSLTSDIGGNVETAPSEVPILFLLGFLVIFLMHLTCLCGV
jgi:hypothetical protein